MPSRKNVVPTRLWVGSTTPSDLRTGDLYMDSTDRVLVGTSDADNSRVELMAGPGQITRYATASFGPMPGLVGNVSTVTPTLATAHYYPLVLGRSGAIDQLAFEVTTAALSSTVRLAIYNSDPVTGKPTTVGLDAGVTSATTTGVKTVAAVFAFNPGIYWIAYASQGGTPTLRSQQAVTTGLVYGTSSAATSTAANVYTVASVSGAFPASPTVTATPVTTIPIIQIRFSA